MLSGCGSDQRWSPGSRKASSTRILISLRVGRSGDRHRHNFVHIRTVLLAVQKRWATAGGSNFTNLCPMPVAEKPVAEKPVAEKPVAEKPAAEKPVAEKPVAEKNDAPLLRQRRHAGVALSKSLTRIAVAMPDA